MGHSFSNVGIYYTLVFIYSYIQVRFSLYNNTITFLYYHDNVSIRFSGCSNFWPVLNVGAVMLGNDKMLFSSPVFWLGLILIPTAVLLLDVTVKA